MKLSIDFTAPKFFQKRRFEAASRNKRTQNWRTGSGDANAQIKGDLATLRERSRDLRRNNPYAHRIIEVITNNVVGKGITTDVSDPDTSSIWKEWAESTDIDFDGRHDIRGLQRLIMDAVAESGEVLIRKRYTSKNKKIPLQYQILEADFLDSTMMKSPKTPGNFVIQGIEFSGETGLRVGYHLYEVHPGSFERLGRSLVSNFIPAEEIIHIFRQERPGQVRGVPWLAPSMMRLKDLDDYEDAQLMKQKVAACFTAFVHDIDGSGESEDNSTIDDDGQRIVPAMIEHLPPGKTISFANPPQIENYKEFTSSHLKAAVSGVGITYESVSGDMSEVNFSSGRMAWIEMGRNVDTWRDQIIVKPFLNEAIKDFKRMLVLIGARVKDASYTHISPRREMIDPTKEVTALVKQIRAGLVSRSEVTASLGRDPEDVLSQIEKDNEAADKAGIILDSDPRRVTEGGKSQVTNKGESDGSSE